MGAIRAHHWIRAGVVGIGLLLIGGEAWGQSGGSEVRLGGAGPRLYGNLEYLLWSVKDAPLSVPLLSTGPFREPERGGFLQTSASTVLYGAPFAPAQGGKDHQPFPLLNGGRLTVGYWLDNARMEAFEGSFFMLEQGSARYMGRSDASGNPSMRVPLYNSVPYRSGGVGMIVQPIEDGVPVALSETLVGTASYRNRLQFWGAEATGVRTLYRDPGFEVSGLAGFRYLNLRERYNSVVNIVGLSGTPFSGQSGWTTDDFKTENQFFGANFGVRGRFTKGPFSAELTTKLGIGFSHESESISGNYNAYGTPAVSGPPGQASGVIAVKAGPNGIFAQPSNSGTRSTNKFAVVPEIQVKLGYDITPSVRLTVGYDFIYYSSVLRPTDQIDRSFSKGLPFGQDTSSTDGPVRKMKTSDFYAHGLNVGVAFRF